MQHILFLHVKRIVLSKDVGRTNKAAAKEKSCIYPISHFTLLLFCITK